MKLEDYESDVTSYAVEITRYLISRGSQLQDAEDAVQDTFVKILELDIFIAPDKLRAWMYRTSIRTYIDRYRRKQHYTLLMQQLAVDLEGFTSMPETGGSDMAELIKKLKPKEQKLLRAYYYEHKSTKSLAEELKISLSKVKVDLFRARKKLREMIEREEMT
ncbi:MAG: RNA polymerase sigma factor [Streptococcaceae bacterium]|nr:RNA polymerase sigma factor [Streptococcaceae bacterium]